METMRKFEAVLPATSTRVESSSPDGVNEEIRRATAARLRSYRSAQPAAIARRLEELDREWDIERLLETNAASLALVGLALGTFVDRKWFALPAVVSAFLLQHALQGWCPPVPFFRKAGVRTTSEIDEERTALRLLRGDFRPTNDPAEAHQQARRHSPA